MVSRLSIYQIYLKEKSGSLLSPTKTHWRTGKLVLDKFLLGSFSAAACFYYVHAV